MKRILGILGTSAVMVLLMAASHTALERDVIYQTSVIDALLAGVYDGGVDFKELKKHGDFGIGTFDALDGEMAGVDGKFFQIRADGVASPVADSMTTPFAVVTFFDRDAEINIRPGMDFNQVQEILDATIETKNIFYAIRIEGEFSLVKTRSVPRQEKPYPPLAQVIEHQPVFEFHGVKGTMVGFRCPAFVKGVNVPGYHFHFLTAERNAGGHVLEFVVKDVKAWIDPASSFHLVLPEDEGFYKKSFEVNEGPGLE